MSDGDQTTDYDFRLLQELSDGQGRSLQFDGFQVIFDPYNKQVRINLTGEQAERLANWEWPK